MQLPSSPSTKKISDLIGMIKREELILQPEFQRKLVWATKHKEAFIDTILKGYPFPEIYIAQSGVDLETFQSQQVVVDGQQRLSSIMSYVNGELNCKNIAPYEKLQTEEKKSFLNYDVVVRDLKEASSDTIKEIFRRINLTQYKLNDIEINNAIYEGEFIGTAKSILDELDEDTFPIFSDNELNRMGDLNYILIIMTTLEEGGYFAGKKDIEDYIIKYDGSYPNSESMRNSMLSVFNRIKSFSLSVDSMWYRKSNFFTLFVEIARAGTGVPANIKERLEVFEDKILANKGMEENDFGKYYSAMYTGTNSRTARITRGELFKKNCLQ